MPRPKKRMPRKLATNKMSGDGGDDNSGAQLETPTGVPLGTPVGTIVTSGIDSATVGGGGDITTAASSETPTTPTEPTVGNLDSQHKPFMSPPTVAAAVAASDNIQQQQQPQAQIKEEFEQEQHQQAASDSSEHTTFQHVKLTTEQISAMTPAEVGEKWSHQDRYISTLHEKMEALTKEVEELRGVREKETRLKGQLTEAQRKEQYHIMRLASKEHELQDMGAQVQELKGLSNNMGGLKHCLLDPAVNLLFERLKRDLETARTKMEETQNELSAWKFTPDSGQNKHTMKKCTNFIECSSELFARVKFGYFHGLSEDLELFSHFVHLLKKRIFDLDEFLLEMDEDTEGMQGTIYYLQQQLRKEKERVAILSAQINNSTTQTNTPTTTPLPPPHDDDNACDAADVDISVARTEEHIQQHQQPNGDARMHSGTGAANVISSDTQVDSPDVNSSSQSGATLTNGRKRTQSEADEVNSCGGVGDVSGGEERDLPVTPAKRTRTDDAEEGELVVGVGGDQPEGGNNMEFVTDSVGGDAALYNGSVSDS
ncbi:unnamed protein product, partial [Meganyctiphanes norvegica]